MIELLVETLKMMDWPSRSPHFNSRLMNLKVDSILAPSDVRCAEICMI